MTGSYDLILPLMIANMSAYALARHVRPVPIYEALLLQDNIHLPHPDRHMSHALEQLLVSSAMTRDPVTLTPGMTVSEALKTITGLPHSSYPVLDDGTFLGLVTQARLRRTAAEGGNEKTLKSIVQSCPHVFSDYPLVRAVVRMQ
jgi:chloride channel protein, CIC family